MNIRNRQSRSFLSIGFGALVALLAGAFAAPSVALAAPTLTCTISPGGTSSTGLCTSNGLAYDYNANFIVSGLPAGSYSYTWTTAGVRPQPISCSGAICNQVVNAYQEDAREKVLVTATNTATQQAYNMEVRVHLFAVCPPTAQPPYIGIHFC